MKLTLQTFLTLDGVMQGPGGADEDRSGGFEHGGWVVPFVDEDFGGIVSEWFAKTDAVLLGRTTYDMFHDFWSRVTDPDDIVATVLNQRPKYIASTTMADASWTNSTVIRGDVVAAVRRLKAEPGGELQVHGSCGLAQSLHDAGLIDEYRLLLVPVVLGEGKQLFPHGSVPTSFTLVDSTPTLSGVVAHTFRPAGTPAVGGTIDIVDGKEVIRPDAGPAAQET